MTTGSYHKILFTQLLFGPAVGLWLPYFYALTYPGPPLTNRCLYSVKRHRLEKPLEKRYTDTVYHETFVDFLPPRKSHD